LLEAICEVPGLAEGTNMPWRPEAIDLFVDREILFGPGKAANAGGVSVSGLEMTQNSMHMAWMRGEVDARLKTRPKSRFFNNLLV